MEPFSRSSGELAVSRRVLLSLRINHELPFKAVHRSSLAVVPQDDSAALNRGFQPRRSARLSPNTLLVRAWRSLIELRIDDALATVAEFEDEIARVDTPVAL